MGHLDYASGTWIDDDSEPSPFQAGSIGEQTALPPPPPVPAPIPAPAPQPSTAPPPPDLSPIAEAYQPPPKIPEVQPAPPPPAPEVPPPGRVVSPAESQNLASINENNAARGDTVGQAGQLDVAAATEKAKAADLAQAEQDAYVKLRQDITNAHAERLKAREAQQGADEQALRDEINTKPAPESFGHKLMAAIAIGLGQYAAIRTGTQNNALKIIEAAAEDKVAAKKAAIDTRRMQAERSGKMTTELRAELDDELRRVNGEHGVILESTKLKLEKELGRLGVPQAQIAANADLQKLGAEALQKREEVLKGIRDDETTLARADIAAAARKKAAGTGGGGGKGLDELIRMKEDGSKDSEIAARAAQLGISAAKYLPSLREVRAGQRSGNNQVGDVHGPGGITIGNIATGDPALDRKRAEEVSKANTIYADLQATLKELDKSVKTEGKAMPSIAGMSFSDTAAKREALHSHALIQLKEMAKLGVLAGPDMAIMEQQLGGQKANAAGVGGAKLGEIQKIVDRGHEKFLDSMGLNGREALPKLRGDAAAPAAPKASEPTGKSPRAPSELSLSDKAKIAKAKSMKPGDPYYESGQQYLRLMGM